MTLPVCIDYEPPLHDLPVSRATWTLDAERAAVLVHDLQGYFLTPYVAGCPALTGALAATERVLRAARSAGVPVIYTAQQGDQDAAERGLQGDLWGPGMSAEPAHTAIVPAIAPVIGDTVVEKRRYSAFARTDLADRLAGRDQLIVVGVYAHIGVTATALDAFQREIRPFVVADAVADLGAEQHRRALEMIASCCGVVILADEVIAALDSSSAADSAPSGSGDSWDERFQNALAGLLTPEAVQAFFADSSADLFELGLDSLRAFDFLDALADDGLDVDFGEFTRSPTLNWLRQQAGSVAA
ncbi:MAG: isochorismatase family protein [Micropruina sp.]|uniref:isochorismatase family protein n=1 Tax=Micropruina sp. TaxID=2737536 RepID=UPI0039E4BE84